jgi:hypothetical protein
MTLHKDRSLLPTTEPMSSPSCPLSIILKVLVTRTLSLQLWTEQNSEKAWSKREESSMEAGSQGRCGGSKSMPFLSVVSWYPIFNNMIQSANLPICKYLQTWLTTWLRITRKPIHRKIPVCQYTHKRSYTGHTSKHPPNLHFSTQGRW